MRGRDLNWHSYKNLEIICLDPRAVSFLDDGESPGSWFRTKARILKSNEKIDAGLVPGPDGMTFFVKRYRTARLWQRIMFRLFRDHVARTLKISRKLIKAGISVPVPLAGIRDFGGKPPGAYFICQALTEAMPLRNMVNNNLITAGKLSKLLTRIAGALALMHGTGIAHGDMKWKNIMIRQVPEPDFLFIDLDTAARMGFSGSRLFALDLARFAVDIAETTNSQDLLRDFLTAYSRETGLEIPMLISKMKPFYRKISVKHKKKRGTETPPLVLEA